MLTVTENDVKAAEKSGNKKLNRIYEANLVEHPAALNSIKPLAGSHGASRARFVREKYVDRVYYSKPAHYKHVKRASKTKTQKSSKKSHSLFTFLKNDQLEYLNADGSKSEGHQTQSTASDSSVLVRKTEVHSNSRRAASNSSKSDSSKSNWKLSSKDMYHREEHLSPKGLITPKSQAPKLVSAKVSSSPNRNLRMNLYSSNSPRSPSITRSASRTRSPSKISPSRKSESGASHATTNMKAPRGRSNSRSLRLTLRQYALDSLDQKKWRDSSKAVQSPRNSIESAKGPSTKSANQVRRNSGLNQPTGEDENRGSEDELGKRKHIKERRSSSGKGERSRRRRSSSRTKVVALNGEVDNKPSKSRGNGRPNNSMNAGSKSSLGESGSSLDFLKEGEESFRVITGKSKLNFDSFNSLSDSWGSFRRREKKWGSEDYEMRKRRISREKVASQKAQRESRKKNIFASLDREDMNAGPLMCIAPGRTRNSDGILPLLIEYAPRRSKSTGMIDLRGIATGATKIASMKSLSSRTKDK